MLEAGTRERGKGRKGAKRRSQAEMVLLTQIHARTFRQARFHTLAQNEEESQRDQCR